MTRMLALSLAALAAACASKAPPVDPLQAALTEAFDQGCLPAIRDGRPIAELAAARKWAPLAAGGAPAQQQGQTWIMTAPTPVMVTGWADGSCQVTVESGETARHRAQLLASLERGGLPMLAGRTEPADRGRMRTMFCTRDRPPVAMTLTTPGAEGGDRSAIAATLFRAQVVSPAFCPLD